MMNGPTPEQIEAAHAEAQAAVAERDHKQMED